MDRFALEHNLRDAIARVAAGQRALMEQRAQIRELERNGFDASPARALLQVYQQSQEMNLFDRTRLAGLMEMALSDTSTSDYDDRDLFEDDFQTYRQAA
ncbi:hypothetical protein [Reyranella sp.]|uniref:hypothetical protein n=1 Tax=Reyranella sp. TaxID=1929291 RepID=UPI003BAAFFA0